MNIQTDRIDVGAVIDSARVRSIQIIVMICACSVTILDGFDIQIMGLAAPALAKDWAIERSQLAPALAAALLGMAIGGFLLGAYGDRRGRRPALLMSVVCFGLGTLATAFANDVQTLTLLRFATGIGLGGALPNATALMAEFAPPKVRSQTIAAALIGVPVGGILGAAIAAEILPTLGWRSLFAIGGALPLAACALIYFTLPESVRFLAGQPQRTNELIGILNRVVQEQRFTASQSFYVDANAATHAHGLRALFSRELRLDTVALWLAFISSLFAVFCFYNWAPVVFTNIGMDVSSAVRGLLVFNTAGVVGSLAAACLIARMGSRWIQVALCGIGAIASFGIYSLVAEQTAAQSTLTLNTALALSGFSILAVQVTLYAVAAHVYPTSCRAAGVGWAQGMGRLGGILSAFAGASLISSDDSRLFLAVTVTLFITVAALLTLKRHLSPALGTSHIHSTDLAKPSKADA